MDAARAFSAEQRKKLAGGAALPDGSFPIVNRQDLLNAIRAFGRAKNKAAAKRHIRKRARALGLTSVLPDSWKGDSAMYECTVCDRAGFVSKAALSTHEMNVHTHDVALVYREMEELVQAHISRECGDGCWVIDMDQSNVIWSMWTRNDRRVLMQSSYSVSDGGDVSLGEAAEVRRVTSYVPVSSSEDAKLDKKKDDEEDDKKRKRRKKGDYASFAIDGERSPNLPTHGTPKTDLPHGFLQDEGSHPFFCSDCGRSRTHPIHDPNPDD